MRRNSNMERTDVKLWKNTHVKNGNLKFVLQLVYSLSPTGSITTHSHDANQFQANKIYIFYQITAKKPIPKCGAEHLKEKSELRDLQEPRFIHWFRVLGFHIKIKQTPNSQDKTTIKPKSCTLPTLEFVRPKLQTKTKNQNATH